MTDISTWIRERLAADHELDRTELRELAIALSQEEWLWRPLEHHDTTERVYHQLYRDPSIDVWLICWMHRQDTGYHDHDRSSGAVCVCEGTLWEDYFQRQDDGWIREQTRQHKASGSFDFFGDVHPRRPQRGRRPGHVHPCLLTGTLAHGSLRARRQRSHAADLDDLRRRAARRCLIADGSRMRLGFVGLGNLGQHLAASLLRAGFPLTVYDRDEAAGRRLVDAGAAWAASPSEVAANSDSVFTCLPSPEAVSDVVTGESGLLAGFRAGGTWIDSSTNDPRELRRLAALATAAGVNCLEAPVTGGVHLAASGEITVLVGGDDEAYAAHLPAFEAIGAHVFHIGPLGSASTIKVITNMLAFVHLVGVGEALMLAKRAGLDLAQSFEVIRASSGNSFVHETESQVILNGSYDIGFTLDLACKDLGFARELGREHGVPLELAGLVEETFARARDEYGGGAWSPMVVKLLEDALGTDLRADGFPAVIS